MNRDDKIRELNLKLEQLSHKHNLFLKEIRSLRQEIHALQNEQNSIKQPKQTDFSIKTTDIEKPQIEREEKQYAPPKTNEAIFNQTIDDKTSQPKSSISLEQFIGENLISKIGILITIIGVVFGAKYSIDNNLVTPLTRIITGYVFSAILLGIGLKLKSKYTNYSAVLVAGAIAMMYFITYSAYSFYDLIPQLVAFGVMLLFTVLTVITAIYYDKVIIALIGLVGAYAVPFFLSDGTGKMQTFFIYVSIINVGILIIAFKRYWKTLYYAAFGFTWLIFLFWFYSDYWNASQLNHNTALLFSSVFFGIFYITFLAYKVVKKDVLNSIDAVLIFINSFVFYGIFYILLEEMDFTKQLLGLFTFGNAIIHGLVCFLIHKQQLYEKKLFYLILSLTLVFVTIAIPVQLDGNWVTLLWTIEAALLFWFGRIKALPFYEKMAFALMSLAFISIVHDWTTAYYVPYYVDETTPQITPIFNINFLTSIFFIAAFWWINLINKNPNYTAAHANKPRLLGITNFLIPAILFTAIYVSFRVEITHYFEQLYAAARQNGNQKLNSFHTIWLINYTLLFLSVLAFVNIKKLKNTNLGFINLALSGVAIAVFFVQGMYEFHDLQTYFFNTQNGNMTYILIRYLSYGFLGLLIFSIFKYHKADFMKVNFPILLDFVLFFPILFVLSGEFMIWMSSNSSVESTKLGLSIIWGVYALILIGIGIWKQKSHLRIGAIALFAITLVKLFFYDISHLATISKTIIFVVLGVLLLIISFLYNKYKEVLFGGEE